MSTPTIYSAVVAMDPNRVIGKDGKLPWHLPGDLRWFKSLTHGHPIIMGANTYRSIGKALPGRRNIVLSRTLQANALTDAEVIGHPDELGKLGLEGEAFVIGGAEIYRLLLPRCQKIYLTYIYQEYEGDTHLPPFEPDFPHLRTLQKHDAYEIREYSR